MHLFFTLFVKVVKSINDADHAIDFAGGCKNIGVCQTLPSKVVKPNTTTSSRKGRYVPMKILPALKSDTHACRMLAGHDASHTKAALWNLVLARIRMTLGSVGLCVIDDVGVALGQSICLAFEVWIQDLSGLERRSDFSLSLSRQ